MIVFVRTPLQLVKKLFFRKRRTWGWQEVGVEKDKKMQKKKFYLFAQAIAMESILEPCPPFFHSGDSQKDIKVSSMSFVQ